MSKEMVSGEFGVTILGRSGLRYRDGSKTAFVDAEMLAGVVDLVVYVNTIKAWEGTNRPVENGEREQMIANIRRVLEEHHITVEFE